MEHLKRFIRTILTGGLATLVDIGVLSACIYLLGVNERLASLPALLCGAAIQFFGNRHFAFRAQSGCVRRQAILFTVTEIVTLGLNALIYDQLMIRVAGGESWPVLARLISTNAVFVLWSFPVWHWVFKRVGSAKEAVARRPVKAT